MKGAMDLMRKVSGILAAVAVLSATAVPITVSACPAPTAKAKSCCCSKPSPGAERGCHCPKPAGGLPGDPCVVQKDTPTAALPSATAPVVEQAVLLFILPASPELGTELSSATHPAPRIQPGWDPGNFGLTVPLRI